MFRIIATASLLFFGLVSNSRAQSSSLDNSGPTHTTASPSADTSVHSSHYVALELDPAPFIFGGYSVSAKFSPKCAEHFTLMGSVYSSRLPDALMSVSNTDKGFKDVKIETSFALFADYFLDEDRTGLHFGPSVFLYSKSVGKKETYDRARFKSIYPNVRVGYLYQPFETVGLYINPWINFGTEIMLDENGRIGTTEFEPNAISYVAAIHVGYQINL
jgi:hypothetical protein